MSESSTPPPPARTPPVRPPPDFQSHPALASHMADLHRVGALITGLSDALAALEANQRTLSPLMRAHPCAGHGALDLVETVDRVSRGLAACAFVGLCEHEWELLLDLLGNCVRLVADDRTISETLTTEARAGAEQALADQTYTPRDLAEEADLCIRLVAWLRKCSGHERTAAVLKFRDLGRRGVTVTLGVDVHGDRWSRHDEAPLPHAKEVPKAG